MASYSGHQQCNRPELEEYHLTITFKLGFGWLTRNKYFDRNGSEIPNSMYARSASVKCVRLLIHDCSVLLWQYVSSCDLLVRGLLQKALSGEYLVCRIEVDLGSPKCWKPNKYTLSNFWTWVGVVYVSRGSLQHSVAHVSDMFVFIQTFLFTLSSRSRRLVAACL